MFIVPTEADTLTAEFCEAPTPVLAFRLCKPAKFWKDEPENARLLLTEPAAANPLAVDPAGVAVEPEAIP